MSSQSLVNIGLTAPNHQCGPLSLKLRPILQKLFKISLSVKCLKNKYIKYCSIFQRTMSWRMHLTSITHRLGLVMKQWCALYVFLCSYPMHPFPCARALILPQPVTPLHASTGLCPRLGLFLNKLKFWFLVNSLVQSCGDYVRKKMYCYLMCVYPSIDITQIKK